MSLEAPSSTAGDSTMEMQESVELSLSDASTDDTTLTENDSSTFPPHEVTRLRFPSLLVLAGNTILNHIEQQQQGQARAKERKSMVQLQGHPGNHQFSERPRKDSKISLEGNEGVVYSGFLESILPKNPSDSRTATLSPPKKKSSYVLQEKTLQSYLTPFLYSMITRARASRRCAGCQQLFLKPCRIMIVWQQVLGQNQVPIQWRGCGLGRCPGIPPDMWTPPTSPLSSAPSSISSMSSSQQSTESSPVVPGSIEMNQNVGALLSSA